MRIIIIKLLGILRCDKCDGGNFKAFDYDTETYDMFNGCRECGRLTVWLDGESREKRRPKPRPYTINRGSAPHCRWQVARGHYVPGTYEVLVPAGPGSASGSVSWDINSSPYDSLGSHIRRDLTGSWRLYGGRPYKDRRPRTSPETEQELGRESDSYMERLRDDIEAKRKLFHEDPQRFKELFPDDYDDWYRGSDSEHEEEVEEPLGK